MKKYFYILTALTFTACSTQTSEDYLTQLTAKRDSLKVEHQKLGEELAKVEFQLTKLDTTKKRVNVTVEKAQITHFKHFFKVYGAVNADNNTIIYPASSGDVVALAVEEGQRVSKGQLLFRIDSEIIRRNIQEVETQRSLAQDVYNKQKSLWDQNIGSEMDYLRAKNNLETLDSRLATLKSQLDKTNVTAPFSGTIDEIFIKTGQLVGPQTATLRIINLDQVYLKAEIPETYISIISKDSPVRLSFPSIGMAMDTKINETGKFINPENRTFTVRVDIENPTNALYPNLMGMLEIQDYGNDSALIVPARIVQEDAMGNSFIFVAEEKDGTYMSQIRKIEVGMTFEGMTEVLNGIREGDLVIDKGSRNVSDGQIVGINS
jgi:RND family efflux transporter MFP subunit